MEFQGVWYRGDEKFPGFGISKQDVGSLRVEETGWQFEGKERRIVAASTVSLDRKSRGFERWIRVDYKGQDGSSQVALFWCGDFLASSI